MKTYAIIQVDLQDAEDSSIVKILKSSESNTDKILLSVLKEEEWFPDMSEEEIQTVLNTADDLFFVVQDITSLLP